MVTRLRYTGDTPTAFSEPRIGMLELGDEFGVPNNQAETYTRRGDIEVVSVEPDETDEPEPAEEPEVEAPAQAPAADPAPAAPEPVVADTAPADVAPDTDTAEPAAQ